MTHRCDSASLMHTSVSIIEFPNTTFADPTTVCSHIHLPSAIRVGTGELTPIDEQTIHLVSSSTQK